MSLTARYLEANGIATVVMAAARDIAENVGLARLIHCDFPLGNPCGVPYDTDMQSHIMDLALEMLEKETEPGHVVTAPYEWPEGDEWKRLVFTEEQPFVEGEALDDWKAAKAKYKELKAKGEV